MAGFEAALESISIQGLAEEGVHPTLMLALGMMLAEFNRTEFADPYEAASLQKPRHVTVIPLTFAHSDSLTEAVRTLR